VSYTAFLIDPTELTTVGVWQIPKLAETIRYAAPPSPLKWLEWLKNPNPPTSLSYTEVLFDLLVCDDTSAIYVRRKDTP
jgi:hypothetical protein